MSNQNKDPGILRYSVVLIEDRYADSPAYGIGVWKTRNRESASWDADLNAQEFASLCQELGLRASCTTQGTQGPAGFEPHHWTPAYCFYNKDEDYQAWVTPWTPAVKAAAIAEIAGQKPENLSVLGSPQPVSVVWLPLWGDRWSEVERMLDREFSEEKWCGEIEPVERLDEIVAGKGQPDAD